MRFVLCVYPHITFFQEESSQIKEEIMSNIPPKLQSELLRDDLYVDVSDTDI